MTSRYLIIVFCIFNPFAIDLSKGVSKYFVKNIVVYSSSIRPQIIYNLRLGSVAVYFRESC